MAAKTNNDSYAFEMTKEEILSLADSRAEQKDANHPENSGSYTNLIKTAKTGREKLEKGSYRRK